MDKRLQLFFVKVKKEKSGCWEWQGSKDRCGYAEFWNGKSVEHASRFIFRKSVSAIPKGMCVCHRCDNPGCVNPQHLFLGTQLDNMRDCISKGRKTQVSGMSHGRSKVTASQVSTMRRLYRKGKLSMRAIGEQYGVCKGQARRIIKAIHWQDVK